METNYSMQALTELEAGDVNKFNHLYELALKNDEDEILYNLAGELFALGFNDEALKIYEKLYVKYPDDDLKILMAEIWIDQDQNDRALEFLNGIQLDSDSYLASLLLVADLYQTEALYDNALNKLKEAYAISDEEPAIIFALAELYHVLHEDGAAAKLYLKLIKKGHADFMKVNIVSRLAISYMNIGQFEKALAYFDQIRSADITNDILFQKGFTYFHLESYDEAIEMFKDLLKLDQNYTSAYVYLVRSYEVLQRWQDGLIESKEGLTHDSHNVELYLLAFKMAVKCNEIKLAEEFLLKAFDIDSQHQEVLTQLTNFWNNQKEFPKVKNLLSNDVEDPHLKWNLAVSLWKTGNAKEALSHFNELKYTLDDQLFLIDYYQILREQGFFNQAVEILEKYVKLYPDDLEYKSELERLKTEEYDYE